MTQKENQKENQKTNKVMKTQILALAATSRINNNRYERNSDILGRFIVAVMNTKSFGAKIAESVDKTFGGYTVAKISEKQAYWLAKAAEENNIALFNENPQKAIEDLTFEEAYEAGKDVYFAWCKLQK